MTDEQYREMAAQLRQPHGEYGLVTGEWMNKGNARMNMDTLAVLNAHANDNILEIGMGNGYFVKDIVSVHPSIQYTGCDFSELMVAEATKLNAQLTAQAKFVTGDITALPFEDDSFNKIITVNTIYFWADAEKALSELRRVLQPAGKLLIALRPKHLMESYPFTRYGFNMFSKEDITKLLSVNNFNVLHVYENKEPDVVLHGETVKVENMVVESVPNIPG